MQGRVARLWSQRAGSCSGEGVETVRRGVPSSDSVCHICVSAYLHNQAFIHEGRLQTGFSG